MRKESLYAIPLAAVFLAIVIVPFIRVVAGSLTEGSGGGLFLGNYRKIFTTPAVLRSIRNSLSLSVWSSLLGGVIGFFFAHVIAGMKVKAQRLLIAVNTLPLTLSAVVLAYGFLVVFGESGVVNAFLKHLGPGSPPLRVNILTIGGLVFVYLIFQVPLMTIILLSAMLAADPHIEEAAMSVGANRFRILFWITVPGLAPALFGGFFLLFINAFGAYATAYSLVGANMNLVTLKIVSQFSDVGYDPGIANALSVMIVVLDTLFVVGYRLSMERVKRRRE